MKKVSKFLIGGMVFSILGLRPAITYSQEIWVGKDGNIRNIDTRGVLIEKGGFYLATKNEIYKSKEIDGKWESIFSLSGGANEINCIGGSPRNIFVGTKRGLFRSQDLGASWKNVFRTIIPDKNHILSIEISKHDPKRVIIGTRSGIFLSEDSGDRWKDISDNLKRGTVRCIAINRESIYAGTGRGLYVRKEKGTGAWERLFVISVVQEKAEEGSPDSAQGEPEEENIEVNCIAIKDERIYMGFDKKISYSDDEGKSWSAYPSEGLAGFINYILPSSKSGKFYCATTKGVFEFNKEKARWLELYKGMDKNVNVNNIRFASEDENLLWALTDKGIYKLENGRYLGDQYVDVEKSLKTLKIAFDSEPSFEELQQAAIRYAEVSADKIKRWRQESRLRALLPKVSFGWDSNRSNSSEIYTSATRDYIVVGPDDVNTGLDMSISWELGDLIWSDDQTNIDVRSKLMVQLRNDILDDLRRAYFERKRIQFELTTEVPKDLKAHFDKEVRLQELTQAIDDLTDNYLSEHMKVSDRL